MSNNFFAYLSRMKYINRWSLMRNTRLENLSEHSLETAIIAHALCIIANTYFGESLNADLAAAKAMFHDSSEIITGDLPTPVKYYNPKIKKAYKEIESIAEDKLLSMLPGELSKIYEPYFKEKSPEDMRVKWADKISAYIKCLEEKKSGNAEFLSAEKTILEAILEIDAPEVKFFMENFIESYSLTLDEQE